jgi:hypothetical protein
MPAASIFSLEPFRFRPKNSRCAWMSCHSLRLSFWTLEILRNFKPRWPSMMISAGCSVHEVSAELVVWSELETFTALRAECHRSRDSPPTNGSGPPPGAVDTIGIHRSCSMQAIFYKASLTSGHSRVSMTTDVYLGRRIRELCVATGKRTILALSKSWRLSNTVIVIVHPE